MLISRTKKFVFLAFNKTGSTSIQQALDPYRSKGLHLWLYQRHRLQRSRFGAFPIKHMPARDVRYLLGDVLYDRYYTFAFVRNPWERLVSVYHYQQQKLPDRHPLAATSSFREYVLAGGSGSASWSLMDFVSDSTGKLLVDDIYQFENIADEFQRIKERLKVDAEFPHVNKSKHTHKSYRDYYDDETKAVVSRWAAKEIAEFGYSF